MSALAGLASLDTLKVNGTMVSDVAPLACLPVLRNLYVEQSRVARYDALFELSLDCTVY